MVDKTIDQDDIFDLDSQATSSEKKSLAYIIFQAIRTNQIDLRTAFPAEVTEVTVTSSLVSIKPMLKRRFIDGKVVDLPIIQNVPVVMPHGFAYSIRVPINVGDTGLAVCADRSMDVWKVDGGTVDPEDSRLHNLSDAVFLPGLYPMSDPVSIQGGADSIAMVNLQTLFAIQPDGRFVIQNKATGDELVSMISELADLVANATVTTIFGPMPLLNAAQVALLKFRIDALVGV